MQRGNAFSFGGQRIGGGANRQRHRERVFAWEGRFRSVLAFRTRLEMFEESREPVRGKPTGGDVAELLVCQARRIGGDHAIALCDSRREYGSEKVSVEFIARHWTGTSFEKILPRCGGCQPKYEPTVLAAGEVGGWAHHRDTEINSVGLTMLSTLCL